ncbi:ATP-binding protein [Maribellus sp. YY47]|uniref:sensor histidine kinase n=1 Tax=Maribellus sp. YY47 TaxID=2929486 RepID=UPI0020005F59|nr:ATP-binding protein [Maribellus sp. YY47]MCK3682917.1 ATP-binding protein [Maribellus sp. YY47]
MVSRHINRQIITRVILLTGNALLLSWVLLGAAVYVLVGFLFLVLVFQVIELINFLNRTNRKIAYFFDAIRNEDSTLNFPEHNGNKSLNELNSSLNKVNELIKQIKFELREQEHYFQTILEHVSTGIITYNEKGTIFLANSAAKNLLGHEHMTHINQIVRIDKKLFNTLKELQPGDNRLVTFNNKTGVVQLSLRSTRFKTATDNLQLVTFHDIKNEMDTKELESWIKLIRVLTHEIMNTVAPITSLSQTILGYFKNLEDNVPSEKIIANSIKGLEVINERGTGLIGFVDTYRKLTRIPPPEKKTVKVGQLIESIITLIKYEPLSEKVKIDWELLPADLEISVDKKQISQVMINLIKNSMEALKNNEEGLIKIKGEYHENGRAQISVTDNGPGIPEDIMDKIFVPFFTTKESGSGIGLSLSRQIMLLHGGRLKATSLPGVQTKFILEF